MNIKRSRYADIVKEQIYIKTAQKLPGENFQSAAPAPFIGRYGYPYVNVGVLNVAEQKENAWEYDAPKEWALKNYQIPKIAEFRSQLLNSRFKSSVKQPGKWTEIAKLTGIASKPVELEVTLKKAPQYTLNTSNYEAPTGPAAALKKLTLTSNPNIATKVDKVTNDTEMKAVEAIKYLYKHEFDENFLSKMLSVGTIGLAENRKLVPTRWSITATDDLLGKNFITQIRDNQYYEYQTHFGGYLGNYYFIMLFPQTWSYELFETYLPTYFKENKIAYSTDYEYTQGRKDYASNTVGGYYTVRLAIAEKMFNEKRQGTALALRFITGEYIMPLGVWVTREAARKSLNSKPMKFQSKQELINYTKRFIQERFGFDVSTLLKESKLLSGVQQTLNCFQKT